MRVSHSVPSVFDVGILEVATHYKIVTPEEFERGTLYV